MDEKKLIEDDLLKLENVLTEGKQDYQHDASLFYKTGIFKMGRFIRLYSELMKRLGAHVNEDVLNDLENFDLEKRLQNFLSNWDNFLQEIEIKANIHLNEESILFLDQNVPVEISSSSEYFLNIKQNDAESFQKISLIDLHKQFLLCNNYVEQNKNKKFMQLVMLRHFAW